MELMDYVTKLQTMLKQHDYAVKQILEINEYIDALSRQTFQAAMYGTSQQVMQLLLRKSVAEGVKRMYKQYRLKKWCKVQVMLQHRARVIQSERPSPGTPTSDLGLHNSLFYQYPDLNILGSTDQTAQGWAVMHCEFSRYN